MGSGNELPGIQAMRQYLAASPFARKLGLEVIHLAPDRAHLRLPYDPSLATVGTIVHGGALGTLADTAATAACWTAVDVHAVTTGATISLTIDYMTAAAETTVDAAAAVIRRGRSICFAEVRLTNQAGEPVAQALATYRFALAA